MRVLGSSMVAFVSDPAGGGDGGEAAPTTSFGALQILSDQSTQKMLSTHRVDASYQSCRCVPMELHKTLYRNVPASRVGCMPFLVRNFFPARIFPTEMMNDILLVSILPHSSRPPQIEIRGEQHRTRKQKLTVTNDPQHKPDRVIKVKKIMAEKKSGAPSVVVDMENLVFLNPATGEGHCRLFPQDPHTFYCHTHKERMHLMVVVGVSEGEGVTAEIRSEMGWKQCDVKLGESSCGLDVAAGAQGTKLTLILYKKGVEWRIYNVLLHLTPEKGLFLPGADSSASGVGFADTGGGRLLEAADDTGRRRAEGLLETEVGAGRSSSGVGEVEQVFV